MPQVSVQIPEQVLVALGLDPKPLGEELLLAAAVRWFESGRLSSGAAAELAGISKPEFLGKLVNFGVAGLSQTGDELREEAANA